MDGLMCSKWWQFRNWMRLTRGICIQKTYNLSLSFFLFDCVFFSLFSSTATIPHAKCNHWMTISETSHHRQPTAGSKDIVWSLVYCSQMCHFVVLSSRFLWLLFCILSHFVADKNQENYFFCCFVALSRAPLKYVCNIFPYFSLMYTFVYLATAGQFIQTNDDRHMSARLRYAASSWVFLPVKTSNKYTQRY